MKLICSRCIIALMFLSAAVTARPQTDEEKIADLMEKGELLFQQKEYDKAETLYKEVLGINNSYADAYNALALLYTDQNREQVAFANAKKAVALDSDNARYLATMGLIYIKLKKNDEAEQILKRAIELDNKNYFAYVYLAEVTKRKTNYPLAIKYAERAAELNLESYIPHEIIAESYIGLQKPREAIAAYLRAELKDRDNYGLYLACGNVYLELGDNKNARSQYKEALSIREDEYELRMKYAGVLKNDGEYDDAGEQFAYVFKHGPDKLKAESAYGASVSMYEEKEYADAETYALEAVKMNPGENKYKKILSDIYEKQGKLDKAAEVMPAPSEDAVNEYMALGLKHEKAGNYAEAAEYYDKALQVDPGNAAFYLKSGLMHTRIEEEKEPDNRNYEKAVEKYTAALDYLKDEPEVSKIAYNLGKIREKQKMYQEAFDSYVRAVKSEPSMLKAYFSLGYSYFRTSPWKKPLHLAVWGVIIGFFFFLYIRHRKKIRQKLEKAHNEGK